MRLVSLLCGLCIGFGWAAEATTARTVPIGSVPPWRAGERTLGAVAASSPLQLTVALAPRDPAGLAAYAAAVSTPGSPSYRDYLSVARFRARFAPSTATVSAVAGSLRAHGLVPGSLSANGLGLHVSGPAGSVTKAFGTALERIALPDGRSGYVNTSAPAIDSTIAPAVQAVAGLDSVGLPKPKSSPRAIAHAGGNCSGMNPAGGGFTINQIAGVYGFNQIRASGNFGAGQNIALYELETNTPADIDNFQQCFGSAAGVSYETVDGGPATAPGSGVETAVDAENLIGLAPAVHLIIYQGANNGTGAYDTFNQIVAENRASVISTSWGECEAQLGSQVAQAESTLFQEAAVQGQTIVAASGDNGSEDCAAPPQPPCQLDSTAKLGVDDPGSQPYVTSVGGTSVLGTTPLTETVWNNCSGASGGGDSKFWAMPTYQAGAPASLGVINSGSGTQFCSLRPNSYCRQVPDVSLDGNPNTGYNIYANGSWQVVGGTSAAAPGWAALFALANASSACAGSSVGFVNPALYRVAGQAWNSMSLSYNGMFNDVTSGQNDWTNSFGGRFAAGLGYDQATGLGTPNASQLVTGLCSQTIQIANPGAQATTAGQAVSLPVSAHDPSGQTIAYSARGLPPGLGINSSSGLISGTATTGGGYDVTIDASDAGGAIGTARFSWGVQSATVTLRSPGTQSTRIGAVVALALHATDNNGQPIRFSATGLPRGLALDPGTGRISGKPTTAGTGSVTVSAAALGAPNATIRFPWRIIGPPSWSHITLSRAAGGTPRFTATFRSGVNAPALRMLSLSVPKGLRIVRSPPGGVSVRSPSGRRIHYRAKVVRGRLELTLRKSTTAVVLVVAAPALKGQIAHAARRHGVIVVSATVRDTAGVSTTLIARLRSA
jgi:subtilase family serine protease